MTNGNGDAPVICTAQENTPPRASGEVLILTNKRTSQHDSSVDAWLSRQKNIGKLTTTRSIPPRFCGQRKYIAVFNKNGKIFFETRVLYCRSWNCPKCQIFKAIQVKHKLHEVIVLNNLNHLLTLTLDPKIIPPEYLSENGNFTHKYITKLFNHFLVTLKRKIHKDIKFVWVIEFQENGNTHLHVVTNKFLPIKVIKRYWVRMGGGHDMSIQLVRSANAMASYLTDYLVKGFKKGTSNNGFRSGEKRYSISQSCKKLNIAVPEKKIIQVDSKTDLNSIFTPDEIDQVYNSLEILK
ncbi:hypothetical protein A2397_01345 [Candidatus Amesbacteria bacterium RIFOXYB1_FULL_44_23]|uniref:Replication-associated protein ORF2/G2P domain-containing protein n=1 Tax=Candidatus Amesbacteria bacterium RIFOXYB1_FULL_44_23 TaxID=1797263 RepID=A0A1F4ZW47_9BACT|nr:MAG: hypothetical protein A2397_01345 [Candidatus Amesbacteria bacterium RIFOXYB1_FULL_44_23]